MNRPTNFLDKIGSLIPGYQGYVDREGRRQTDRLLREKGANLLYEIENVITNKMKEDAINKDIDKLKAWEYLRKSLNTLQSKIKYAPYGVSSFFSDEQIREEELLKIYKWDNELLTLENEIKFFVSDYSNENLSQIMKRIHDIENILVKRNVFIQEHK